MLKVETATTTATYPNPVCTYTYSYPSPIDEADEDVHIRKVENGFIATKDDKEFVFTDTAALAEWVAEAFQKEAQAL